MSIANMSIQVIPCSNTTNSDIYSLVDKGIEVIQQSGLKYLVGPLGTSVDAAQGVTMEEKTGKYRG